MSQERMTERYAEPFSEPDGRTTWVVREYVYEPDRYFRQIVSWHETRAEAVRAAAVPVEETPAKEKQ